MDGMHFYLGTALAVTAVAAAADLKTGHIPNWLTLGAWAAASVLHVARGAMVTGWSGAATGALTALAGSLVCLVLPAFLHRASGMGGGDVKLLGAIGALCGPVLGMQVQVFSFVVALLYVPAKLAYAGTLFQTVKRSVALVAYPFVAKERRVQLTEATRISIKFAPAVLGGVVTTALSHWRLP
jgi:prepilin peptidase CpaA